MKKLSKLLSVLLCLAMVIGIFAMSGIAAAEDEKTATFSTSNITGTADATSVDGESYQFGADGAQHISLAFSKGTGSTTPKYYSAGFRFYQKNTIVITPVEGWRILSIKATAISSSYTLNDDADFSNCSSNEEDDNATTIIPADGTQAVTITVNKTNSNQFRWSQITVTYQDASLPVPTVEVTGVSLASSTATTTVGETITLGATVTPSNATVKTLTWGTSDPTIATVDAQGNVFALKAGEVTITATSNNNKTASCAVTISEATTTAGKADANTTFAVGDQIIVIEESNAVAMSSTPNSGKRYSNTAAAISEKVAAVSSSIAVLTLEAGTDPGSFKLKLGNTTTYLYWITGENQLKAGEPTPETAGYYDWYVSSEGITSVNQDTEKESTRSILCNPGSGYFSAYTGTSQYVLASSVYKVGHTPAPSIDLNEDTLILDDIENSTFDLIADKFKITDSITWTSSNPEVATVDANGKVTAQATGKATITASANGVSDTCTVKVFSYSPYVSDIYDAAAELLDNNEKVPYENSTFGVITDIDYAYDSSKNYMSLTIQVGDNTIYCYKLTTYESNDAALLAGYKAQMAALKVGDKIEVTGQLQKYNDKIQFASGATLSHVPVTSITFEGLDAENPTVTIVVGNQVTITPIIAPTYASTADLGNFVWNTNDEDGIIELPSTSALVIKGLKVGTATVDFNSIDLWSDFIAKTITVNVVADENKAASVTLNKTEATLEVDGTVDLTATVTATDTNKDCTDTLTWETSNADVATVVGGKVTAVGVGTATITAKAGDKTATCTITVAVNVSKVELDKTTANMTVGGETTLTATVTVNPNADTYKNVTWTTSDATIATVENGKVKALKAGTVTITATSATDSAKKAECTITITEPVVSTNEGKITSLEDLVTGTYVLVVDTGFAPGVFDNGWLTAVEPTIEGDKVTDAKGGIWTLTVADGKVTITDANGVTVAPKGGNSNGIKEGDYQWNIIFKDGKFIFAGTGDDTVYLASNSAEKYGNKFRGYKTTTCKPENTENTNSEYATVEYPYEFTLYAVATTGGDDTTGDSGNTGDTGNTGSDNKDEAVKNELTKQDAPTAGKSFKLGMYQENLKKYLYFAGTATEKQDYYMATTEDPKEAVDVTVEAVEGGYRLYFTKDGVKTYLDIYQNGNYVNLRLTDEPTAVWTWNTEYKTFVADVEGETYYFGTYKTYNTLSASKLSYASTSFPAGLYLDQPSSTGDAFEPMVIILALAAVSALAVLVLNKKKFSF